MNRENIIPVVILLICGRIPDHKCSAWGSLACLWYNINKRRGEIGLRQRHGRYVIVR
jgi:hypothetical protein